MNFLCDTPYVECHVRNEFLYDQAKGQGEYTEATIFGFRAEPARVPMFQVMLASGAQWARIPIHALCIAPCEPLSVDLCAWWDSYGYHAQVHAFAFLRNHRVSALGRDGQIRAGSTPSLTKSGDHLPIATVWRPYDPTMDRAISSLA